MPNIIRYNLFIHADLNSKDILGHVYEYMLGQFALAEGKKGGQFYIMPSTSLQLKCHLPLAA
jgi:type I restriction-modification system DNA methylase subunit